MNRDFMRIVLVSIALGFVLSTLSALINTQSQYGLNCLNRSKNADPFTAPPSVNLYQRQNGFPVPYHLEGTKTVRGGCFASSYEPAEKPQTFYALKFVANTFIWSLATGVVWIGATHYKKPKVKR